MKKLVTVFVFLCLFLFGCAAVPDQSNASNNSMQVGYPALDSLTAYEQFVGNFKGLPEDFVFFDSVSALGDFQGFVPTVDFPNRYQYSFCDSNGRVLYLEVSHKGRHIGLDVSEYELAAVSADMTSMRKKAEGEAKTAIIRNGVEYYYKAGGSLLLLTWSNNGIHYNIHGQLPTYENSFLNRLVSISEVEANAAFAEVKPDLETE